MGFLVDQTSSVEKYKKVQELNWNETEKLLGKIINQERLPTIQKSENILVMVFLPTSAEYIQDLRKETRF